VLNMKIILLIYLIFFTSKASISITN
jgi:hypothetical protein